MASTIYDTRRFLGSHPMLTAVIFVMTGVLPLYLTSAQIVSLGTDLSFDAARLGYATATYFGSAAVLAPAAGRYVRSHGGTPGLRLGSALAAAAGLIGALSPVWWSVLIATAVAGVANSFMQVGTNLLLVRVAASNRQAISFGAKQASIPMASGLAGILLPLVGVFVGWRWSFALAVGVALVVRSIAPEVPHERPPVPRVTASRTPVPRALVYLGIAGACGGAAGNAVSLFVVPSAVNIGISEVGAGSILAASSALVVAIRIGTGWLTDKRRTSGHNEMATMLGMGVVGCAALAWFGTVPLYVLGMTVAMIGSWGWPGLVYYTVTSTNPDQPARASGVVLASNLTGTLIGPFVVGQFANRDLYPAAWTFCALLSAVALGAMLISGRTYKTSIIGTGRPHHPAGATASPAG